MKRLIFKTKRFFLTRVMVLFNLSAVAFAFQACYGTPQDMEPETMVSGYITAADTGEPIAGIEVESVNYYSTSISEADGYYAVYIPRDSLLRISCKDVDGAANGQFIDKLAVIKNPDYKPELIYNLKLNRSID